MTAILKLSTQQSGKGYFYIIWKTLNPGEFKPVYKSEGSTYQNGKQVWRDAIIDTLMLCNAEDDLEMRLDVMKADDRGNHKFIAS